MEIQEPKYSAHLYSELENRATNIEEIEATYDEEKEDVDARLVIRNNFDALLSKNKKILMYYMGIFFVILTIFSMSICFQK